MNAFDKTVKTTLAAQRDFFRSGATLDLKFRQQALTRLYDGIISLRSEIHAALYSDLRKGEFEAIETETSGVLEEIMYMRRHLKKWLRPRCAAVHLNNFPASGRIYPEPYGSVLIFSAWNYPFQLALSPLVAALAAGNCIVLKPAGQAPATAEAIRKLLHSCFDPAHVSVTAGGHTESETLLRNRFDYIFYTGGLAVGRKIMLAAAENLTPVTLEMGGKSPCIVAGDAKIELCARRLAWGKFLNAGQTCIAPDYLLVHESVKSRLLEKLKLTIGEFYGNDPRQSPDYPRIISERHFERLCKLMENQKLFCGGKTDKADLYIEPTIIEIDASGENAEIMREEIFGALLPVISWKNFNEVIDFINARPKPLAMYYFSQSRKDCRELIRQTSSGALLVNDTITHFINPSMPFGGVGESGIGAYHGKYGFDTFSHYKPVMRKSTLFDIPLRYPPFAGKLGLLKRMCK
ncbi:MAG: aldehyde dehydrogenase [Victivallales bacterium]|nr:aldehyde dehydrogenase [Victivallales bacterium]